MIFTQEEGRLLSERRLQTEQVESELEGAEEIEQQLLEIEVLSEYSELSYEEDSLQEGPINHSSVI